MKTVESYLIEEGKFNANGITKLIQTVESVIPHMPGNWGFKSTNDKLFWIYSNKEVIEEYLEKEKPAISDEEWNSDNWFSVDNENMQDKIKRLNEIQSASTAIRYYHFEEKEWDEE